MMISTRDMLKYQERELTVFRKRYIHFLEGACEEPLIEDLSLTNQIRARYWISSIEEARLLVQDYIEREVFNDE